MAAGNFERALKLVLVHEGGYVDHPADPGGATNLGVTIGTLSGVLGRPATKAEVRALTRETVAPIYKARYWDAVHGDLLPRGVDYAVFDFAVNSGKGRAIPSLQRAIGVADDGLFGPITLANVTRYSAALIIQRICDDRMTFLRRLSTWQTFGKGWTRRVEGVRREAMDMAMESPAPASAIVLRPTPNIPADPLAPPAPRRTVTPPAPPTPPIPPALPQEATGLFATILKRLRTAYPRKG